MSTEQTKKCSQNNKGRFNKSNKYEKNITKYKNIIIVIEEPNNSACN